MQAIGFIFLSFVLALALSACGPGPSSASPEPGEVRIAALSPAVAVILRDLGLHSHIVARHGWDLALDKSIPVGGDQMGLDYEALLRAQPTHVLLEWGARPLPSRLEQLAKQNEWTVQNYRLLTLDDIVAVARDLHERFGGVQPWAATPTAARLRHAFALREDVASAGRILLLQSATPPSVLGPGSAHQQILEAIGGHPAITDGKPFIVLDLEDVLRMAPDGIILIPGRRTPGSEPTPNIAGYRRQFGRLATLDIPAVRNARLAVIDHPLGQLPSTALAEVADEMAEILLQWSR